MSDDWNAQVVSLACIVEKKEPRLCVYRIRIKSQLCLLTEMALRVVFAAQLLQDFLAQETSKQTRKVPLALQLHL